MRHLQPRFPFMNRFRMNEKVSTDTIFASVKAVSGYNCAQVFFGHTSKCINVYPMKSKSQFPEALADFLRNVGIPNVLRRDNAKEENSAEVKKQLRKMLIGDEFSEPGMQFQNTVEPGAIKWIKAFTERLLNTTGAPDCLWFEALEYLTELHNCTAKESMRWQVPKTVRFGHTIDISHLLAFEFYEPVYYLLPDAFPKTQEQLGYWIGPAEDCGDCLTWKIWTSQGTIVRTSLVRSASKINKLNLRLPTTHQLPHSRQTVDYQPKRTIFEPAKHKIHDEDDNDDNPLFGMKKPIIKGGTNTTQHHDSKPNLEPAPRRVTRSMTRIAKIGHIAFHAAAFIMSGALTTEHNNGIQIRTYEKVDLEAYRDPETMTKQEMKMDQDTDLEEKVSEAKPMYELNTNELRTFRYNHLCDRWNRINSDTRDEEELLWEPIDVKSHFHLRYKEHDQLHFKVRWMNGETSIQKGEQFMRENPNIISKYAMKNGINRERDFRWVNKYQKIVEEENKQSAHIMAGTTEERLGFLAKSKTAIKYKFGIQVPTNARHAIFLDAANGDNLWKEAIDKELNEINHHKTFREVREDDNLDEYQMIPYHLVFDAKFDGRRKARLVMGGNWTDPPKEDIYSGVVGIETVRLAFQLASLNGLKVCAADVGTAFLYGLTKEKVYVIAGAEFGPELKGKKLILHKGCYGLRSSAARFHEHLAHKIRELGFTPTKVDADLYMRKHKDGYYEYIATYVDDLLIMSKEPMALIAEFKKTYVLKGVGEPEYYLGGNVIMELDEHWKRDGINIALSAETYIQQAIERLERILGPIGTKFDSPMIENDHPETDDTELCDAKGITLYRSIIGSLNWINTLGRMDIAFALQSLARFNMAPRVGHLRRAVRVMSYLKKHRKGRIICDNTMPDYSKYETLPEHDWTDFYPDAHEELPPNMPEPLGSSVRISCYVDADHAHCTMTRRSVTGIILFVNNMPIKWVSKRQSTVESSTYGSELVAARIATDMIVEMRYYLRMLGVQVHGKSFLFGDNKSVVLNTTTPSSMLKKKHNAIAYHRVREAAAAGIVQFVHIESENNPADICTKSLGPSIFLKHRDKLLFRKPSHLRKME